MSSVNSEKFRYIVSAKAAGVKAVVALSLPVWLVAVSFTSSDVYSQQLERSPEFSYFSNGQTGVLPYGSKVYCPNENNGVCPLFRQYLGDPNTEALAEPGHPERAQRSAEEGNAATTATSSGMNPITEVASDFDATELDYIRSQCDGDSYYTIARVSPNENLWRHVLSYTEIGGANFHARHRLFLNTITNEPWERGDKPNGAGVLLVLPQGSEYASRNVDLFYNTINFQRQYIPARIGLCALPGDHSARLIGMDRQASNHNDYGRELGENGILVGPVSLTPA